MSRFMLSMALLVLAAGCTSNTQPPEKSSNAALPSTQPATQASAKHVPINKFCAVNTTDKVDPDVTYLYNGQLIGFCCKDCIADFKKDPEKYMKTLK